MTLPKLTFILGAAASGKSRFAETMCVGSGKSRIYVATSQVWDDETRTKVDAHVAQRGDGWRTIEEPLDISGALAELKANHVVLVDCATLWLTNVMLGEHDVEMHSDRLIAAMTDCPADIVIVSNEVGAGIVPDNALSRSFRNAQGTLNQRLAAESTLAVNVIAGLPIVLKGQLP